MIEHLIEEGQLVRITVENEVVLEGPCVYRGPARLGDYLEMAFKIASLKTLLYKYPIDESYAAGSDYSDIVEDCCHDEAGVVPGNIDTSSVTAEIMNTDSQSKGQILDTLADNDSLTWWINYDDYTLDFADNLATVEDAPYTLDGDFGTFSDYRDVVITSDYDNYSNTVAIIGKDYDGMVLKAWASDKSDYDTSFITCGYDTAITKVINNNNMYFTPIRGAADDSGAYTTSPGRVVDTYPSNEPTILVDDVFYNKTRDKFSIVSRVLANSYTISIFDINPEIPNQAAGDTIMYHHEFSMAAKDRACAHGGLPKLNISFNTQTPGFKVRQKLYFNDSKMGITKTCAITDIEITDLGAGLTEYKITAESKTEQYFNVIQNSNYVKFFKEF